MERSKGVAFFRSLLRAQELRPETGSDAWTGQLLSSVRDALGAACVYLGSTQPGGWTCRALVGDELRPAQPRRLGGLARRLAATGGTMLEPVLRRGGHFRSPIDGVEGVRAAGYVAAAVPVREPRRVWIVALRVAGDPPFDDDALFVLNLAAETAAVALANEVHWQELETLAMTDGLTLIPNYRFLRQAVDSEIASALRRDEYFTVVMVDVDNLKIYNATHGHLAGSEILRQLARILRENVRRSDLVGKYGGDEFLLVLPRTRPSGGVVLADRVRRRVAETLRGRGGEFISCSFGVAGFPVHGCDFESLIRAADQALFRAKSDGRNAVVTLAGTEPVEEPDGEGIPDGSREEDQEAA